MVGWQVCCSSPVHKILRGYYMRLLWVENKSYSSYDTNYGNEHSLPLAYASKAVKC